MSRSQHTFIASKIRVVERENTVDPLLKYTVLEAYDENGDEVATIIFYSSDFERPDWTYEKLPGWVNKE
jgi:hypothetical protein